MFYHAWCLEWGPIPAWLEWPRISSSPLKLSWDWSSLKTSRVTEHTVTLLESHPYPTCDSLAHRTLRMIYIFRGERVSVRESARHRRHCFRKIRQSKMAAVRARSCLFIYYALSVSCWDYMRFIGLESVNTHTHPSVLYRRYAIAVVRRAWKERSPKQRGIHTHLATTKCQFVNTHGEEVPTNCRHSKR